MGEINKLIHGFDGETNESGVLKFLDVRGLYYNVSQKNVSSRAWSGLIWLRIGTGGGQL
jgi:hypothetical protein